MPSARPLKLGQNGVQTIKLGQNHARTLPVEPMAVNSRLGELFYDVSCFDGHADSVGFKRGVGLSRGCTVYFKLMAGLYHKRMTKAVLICHQYCQKSMGINFESALVTKSNLCLCHRHEKEKRGFCPTLLLC